MKRIRYETVDGRSLGHRIESESATTNPPDIGRLIRLDGSDVRFRLVAENGDNGDRRRTVDIATVGDDDHAPSSGIRTRERVSSTDGVEVALHHLGGDGPPLLICHATGFHGMAYAPLGEALAADFDVYVADLRGHGSATAPLNGDYAWRGMGEDVQACVDAIGAESLFAVGHSMGGAAILLAELARPGSFAGAYLYEPIVFPRDHRDGRGENPMSGPARKRRPVFESKQAAYERYASRPPLSRLRPDALAAYVAHGFVPSADGGVRLACDPEDEALTFEADDKINFEQLIGLHLKLMVAHGTMEEMTATLAPAIAEAVDGAIVRPHPELGHFGPLEDPEAIARDIIGWIG